MKIVHVHSRRPIAGMPYRIAASVAELMPDSTVTRIQGSPPDLDQQMGFPCGKSVTTAQETRDALVDADVIHAHATDALSMIPEDIARKTAVVLTIHGQRANLQFPPWVDRVTVVTPDLLRWHKTATWIPNYLWKIETRKSQAPADGPLHIFCPVGHVAKNHADFNIIHGLLPGMATDIAKGCGGSFNNTSVLSRMNAAHVVWDHLQGYYGLTSLEAMAMGAIPIAVLSIDVATKLRNFWGVDSLPWMTKRGEHTPTADAFGYVSRVHREPAFRADEQRRVSMWYNKAWNWRKPAQMYVDLYRSLVA